MGVVSEDLRIAVEHLRVAKGQIPNVHSAALRDLSNAVKQHVEQNWPVDTGTSLSGWHILKTGQVEYTLMNQVPYTGHVWVNVTHQFSPQPLAIPLIEQGIAMVNADTIAFLSRRVSKLIVP